MRSLFSLRSRATGRIMMALAVSVGLAATTSLVLVGPAAADTPISVPCDPTQLVSAFNQAVQDTGQGERVVLELAASCTYSLTSVAYTDPVYGPSGLPYLEAGFISIDGNGATITRSSAAPAFRILQVGQLSTVRFADVTLSGGTTLGGGPGAPVGNAGAVGTAQPGEPGPAGNAGGDGLPGGGLLNQGALTLSGVTIDGNTTGAGGNGGNGGAGGTGGTGTTKDTGGVGGVGGQGGGGGAGGEGGGIYNSATGNLTITGSAITGNTTGQGGTGGQSGPGGSGGNSENPIGLFDHSNAGGGGAGGAGGVGGHGGNGAGVANGGGTIVVDATTVSGNVGGSGGPGGAGNAGGHGGDGPGIQTGAAGSGGAGGAGGTAGSGGSGGGLFSSGTLTLTGSTVQNNAGGTVAGNGGAAGAAGEAGTPGDNEDGSAGGNGGDGGDAGAGGSGGGVASTGTLTVTATTISGNHGGDAYPAAINNFFNAFQPGARGADGGDGTPSSLANDNGAMGNGGSGGTGSAGGSGGFGGGIAVLGGEAVITGSTIRGNASGLATWGGSGGSGGDGPNGLPGSTTPAAPHGAPGNGGNGGDGGDLGSSVGGGVYNAGTLTLGNTTIGDNSVPQPGFPADVQSGGGAGGKGGSGGSDLSAFPAPGGTGGAGGTGGNAGMTNDGGGLFNTGVATIANVTFNDNHACAGDDICSHSGPFPTDTQGGTGGEAGPGVPKGKAGNTGSTGTALVFGGDSIANVTTTAAATNSLNVANTVLAPQNGAGALCHMSNAPTDSGGNLSADNSCAVAGGGTDPGLSSAGWADNGGPTQTIAITAGSAAFEHGVNAVCAAAPVSGIDQRGIQRPQFTQCDSGAYELASQTQTTSPFRVTTTENQALGVCSVTECTLPDALAAAAATNAPATINVEATGTIAVPTTPFTATGDLTIAGPATGSLTFSGPQLFVVPDDSSLTLASLTVTGAPVPANQHMISVSGILTLTQVSVSGNLAYGGPSMIFASAGQVIINNSTLADNSAQVIENQGGLLQISGSTFTGNQIPDPVIEQGGVATIVNSTFTGNSSSSVVDGEFGTTTLINNTFSGNSGAIGADVSFGQSGIGQITATNSIFDSSFQGSCAAHITDGGNNLETGNTCGLGLSSLPNTAPQLESLGDNGGPTQTMNLAATSPARNAGNDTACQAAPVSGVDQRGVSRLQGAHCDIGAVEADATLGSTDPGGDPTTGPGSGFGGGPTHTGSGTKGPTLAATGFGVGPLLDIGLVGLVLGAALLVIGRRHRAD